MSSSCMETSMEYVKKGNKKQKVVSPDIKNRKNIGNGVTLLLADAVKHITSGDAKDFTPEQLSQWLSTIGNSSQTSGLCEKDLIALIGIIGNEELHVKARKQLIACLIPIRFVPEDAIVNAVCCITLKTLPTSLQVHLVRWMTSMYDCVDKTEVFSHLYSILFEFLRSEALSSDICELLCKITRKEHVVDFRIRRLIMLKDKLGAQPHISTLLKLYADHKPDLLLLVTSKRKKIKPRDVQIPITPQGNEDRNEENSALQTIKRRPAITNYLMLNDEVQHLNGTAGIVKLCSSPSRRMMFTSNIPESLLLCFRASLQSGLFTDKAAICSPLMPNCSKTELMLLLSELASELHEGIPEALLFIGSYLRTWDGQADHLAVFNLISRWEICKYKDLCETILQPLHKLFYSSSLEFMCSVIRCLTNLFQHWVVFELPRFFQQTGKLSTMVRDYKILSIFQKEYEAFVPEDQINALVVFIGRLCDTAILQNPHKQAQLLSCIVKFYETVLLMNSYNRSILLLMPSQLIMASLLFCKNPFFLNETCALICRYRDAMRDMKRTNTINDLNARVVSIINTFIIDTSNMLALGGAFLPREDSAFFQNILPSWLKRSAFETNESLNICRHPALFGLASLFRRKQDTEIQQDMLLKDSAVRKEYLEYLSSLNFSDISSFLYTFINSMALL